LPPGFHLSGAARAPFRRIVREGNRSGPDLAQIFVGRRTGDRTNPLALEILERFEGLVRTFLHDDAGSVPVDRTREGYDLLTLGRDVDRIIHVGTLGPQGQHDLALRPDLLFWLGHPPPLHRGPAPPALTHP